MTVSDESLVAMSHSKLQHEDGTYVAHKAYEIINEQVAAGRQWAKCPNCGDPYPLDKPGCNVTTCSQECRDDYLAYVEKEATIW